MGTDAEARGQHLAPPLWDALPHFVEGLARLESIAPLRARSATVSSSLLDILEWHGLLPLAPALLARLGHAPPRLEDGDLETRYLRHRRRSAALHGELVDLVDLFRDRAITAVPFKGPILGVQLYGDPGARRCLDLDFLVTGDQAPAARALLEGRGYAVSPDIRHLPHNWLRRWAKNVRLTQSDVEVELHWSALDPPAHRAFVLEALWPGLASVSIEGRTVRTLSRPQLALYLAAHGGRHAWNRAAWLVDFAQLVHGAPELDWQSVRGAARSCGRERSLLLAFRLAGDLLGVPTPPALAARVQEDRYVRVLAQEASANLRDPRVLTARPWALQAFQVRLFERRADQARLATHLLFTPNVLDWRLLSLPPRLSWFYTVLKPVRLMWSCVRSLLARAAS